MNVKWRSKWLPARYHVKLSSQTTMRICEPRPGIASPWRPGGNFMWKCGGARAVAGGSLDDVIAVAQKAVDRTRSVGIGLSPCTLPAVGHPNFEIADGTMELGIGHHGEPGVEVVALEGAEAMAARMTRIVLGDLPYTREEAAVLLSGLGATPVMELYILYDEIEKILSAQGIKVYRAYVGNYFTSLEMMGATLTIMKLDEELKELLDAPCESMGLTQVSR